MPTETATKRGRHRRVVYLRRNHIAVVPPKEVRQHANPIVASIGVLADFPLWDEFMAEMQAHREEQNRRFDEAL